MSFKGKKLHGGISHFTEIINNNYVYVDKTDFISEFLGYEDNNPECSATLITRPRRFGKSLMMDMLCEFFSCTNQSSRPLFEGLKIAERKAICEKWQNQYPVIFFTFKDFVHLNIESSLINYRSLFQKYLIKNPYLTESSEIPKLYRDYFAALLNDELADSKLFLAMSYLIAALRAHWHKQVIVLIDEYDVPLNYAAQNGYYKEMLTLMKNTMGALKDNLDLKFAILTGCLRISKESLFTGNNNFHCCGIGETEFADKFGFSAAEVQELLKYINLEDHYETAKAWYDGYLIGGNEKVFNTWDVISYALSLKKNPLSLPMPYWANTGSYEIFENLLKKYAPQIAESAQELLSGNSITLKYNFNLTYNNLNSNINNFWMLLLATGYLTFDSEIAPDLSVKIKIPNFEIKELFSDVFFAFLDDILNNENFSDLQQAFFKLDAELIKHKLNNFLYNVISYNDYQESFYHGVIAGIWRNTQQDIIVKSNQELGLGRPDLTVINRASNKALVIEFKTAADNKTLDKAAAAAVQQIRDREYAQGLEKTLGYEVGIIGIAFCKKECQVLCEKA